MQNPSLNGLRNLPRRTELAAAGHVGEALVNAVHLHERRVLANQAKHAPRVRSIQVEVRVDEYQ
ncbi:hypothetical protein GCM10025857_29130 [Alicyclobacillus contaminans]|nr:hypothetical protein GCM10025857_29130 [Alicyclobacillus contaminans]